MIDPKPVRELCARIITADDEEFRRLVVELAQLLDELELARKPKNKGEGKGAS